MNNPLGLKFLLRISFRLSHLKKCSFSHDFENEINPHCNQQLIFSYTATISVQFKWFLTVSKL